MTMINRKTITMTIIRCGDDKKKKRIMAIGDKHKRIMTVNGNRE